MRTYILKTKALAFLLSFIVVFGNAHASTFTDKLNERHKNFNDRIKERQEKRDKDLEDVYTETKNKFEAQDNELNVVLGHVDDELMAIEDQKDSMVETVKNISRLVRILKSQKILLEKEKLATITKLKEGGKEQSEALNKYVQNLIKEVQANG